MKPSPSLHSLVVPKKRMKTEPEIQTPEIELEEEIEPSSNHGRMPLFLLLLWIGNITFFFAYFLFYGLPDLLEWLK
jgi:hypothetical protein